MNSEAFQDYFKHVLDSYVPAEPRECIRNYWQRFKSEPIFYLDDASINASFGSRTKVAAVTGAFCLHIFGFRPFLFENAPELVLRTVVQHELAHCSVHCHEDPSKLINEHLFKAMTARYATFNSYDMIRERVARVCSYNSEESVVSIINSRWGGDDAAAWAWCEEHWAKGH